MIPHKWARLRESALLDECRPEILRSAQDDKSALCHPERSEGSLAHLWGITRSIIQIFVRIEMGTHFLGELLDEG